MKVINLEDVRHSIRVANLSIEIARQIHLSKSKIDNLYISCLFHDIGKAFIDQSILNKPGQLTDKERWHVQQHPVHSYNEILKIGYSEDIANNILYHHENWNGTGYPKGLIGNAIPIGARILRLADVFDALNTKRPYRKDLSIQEALNIMDKEKDHYDPELYEIFVNYMFRKFKGLLVKKELYGRELRMMDKIKIL